MNKEKLAAKLKKYTVIDIIKTSCAILLALLLITLIAREGRRWWIALIFSVALFGIFEINSLFSKRLLAKNVMYSIEYIILFVFSLFFPNFYLSTIYSVILVDFYMNNKIRSNCAFGALCYIAYIVSIMVRAYIPTPAVPPDLSALITSVFNELAVFLLVFAIANMLSAIISRNKRIEKNLVEIAERERRLQEAYDSLKEITKLEERNRIAKQIHDTTGHSITTIIMQTEAAKLQIETNPAEAKKKIVSANLQAVTALEELRKSVRVLSGENTEFDLIPSLLKAINETTEGTDISIRSKIPESLNLGESEAFFIYSSLKEGLNNGIRHGGANAFYFELKQTNGKLQFLLSDNGKGCNEPKLGFGLRTMKENAEKFGGTAEFINSPGEGFEIKLTLPIKEGEND